jgi:methyltransferase (TIGR00027 family)
MSNGVDQTAVGPMTIIAVDQHESHPLVRDKLARQMLPAGVRLMSSLTRWRPIRRWLVKATEQRAPGLWASMLCRKRYIHDKLVEAIDDGIGAVVILGAGLDTLAYRLPALGATPVFEVDLPANIKRKRSRLCALFGEVPNSVTLVPTDFQAEGLAETMAAAGYSRGAKTFFVWEAVTQYLTEDEVRKTFDFLADATHGSRLVFTYIRNDFLDGTASYGAAALHREFVMRRRLWHFGIDPDRVGEFLTHHSWLAVDQLGSSEFTSKYLRPNGRELPVSDIERSVYAEKP